jgi:hypothetical protein
MGIHLLLIIVGIVLNMNAKLIGIGSGCVIVNTIFYLVYRKFRKQ